jgi:hypothetical protein
MFRWWWPIDFLSIVSNRILLGCWISNLIISRTIQRDSVGMGHCIVCQSFTITSRNTGTSSQIVFFDSLVAISNTSLISGRSEICWEIFGSIYLLHINDFQNLFFLCLWISRTFSGTSWKIKFRHFLCFFKVLGWTLSDLNPYCSRLSTNSKDAANNCIEPLSYRRVRTIL